jgi:phage protein D
VVVAAYRLEVNGRDVTETWRRERRLLSIEVSDKLGVSSDSVSLELDDRSPHIAWPPVGAELRVWLGASENELHDLGSYTLDVPEASGPPHRLRVSGHAANFVAGSSMPMHTLRSRLWQGASLSDMAETIARDHGLNCKVAEALQGASVGTVEQIDETDLTFLSRPTIDLGGRVRVRAGQLEILPAGQLISKAVALTPKDLQGWNAPLGERHRPGSVVARWNAPKSGKAGEIAMGKGEPILVLGELFDGPDAARSAAKSLLDDKNRDAAQLSLSLTGLRTDIGAGQPLSVSGLRSEIDGTWTAVEVAHRADAGAARTAITAQTDRA